MATAHSTNSAFNLPARLHRKADPQLIADDELAFARIGDALAEAVSATAAQLAAAQSEHARSGERALERDLQVHRLSARLRVLRRFGLDACIGRMTATDGTHHYLGRFGLAGADGDRVLVDWRAPAAEPFFAAGGGHPMGLTGRRRYRWSDGRIVDFWDEVFAADGVEHGAALDDQSAFIESLGAARSARMRDVLATLQADQDAIIRADSRGALVVDGGPGTGKTVAALHRAAYLMYADPRLSGGRGGLLFIGPHRPYVDYIDDVLPDLGEDGALVATFADLVAGGDCTSQESDDAVRRIKGDVRLADAVEHAVRLWERPPEKTTLIETAWGVVEVTAANWAEVFQAAGGDMSHNGVHGDAWERLVDVVADRVDTLLRRRPAPDEDDSSWSEGWADERYDEGHLDAIGAEGEFDAYGLSPDDSPIRDILAGDAALRSLFDRAWPLLDPDALVRGLWTQPDLLHACAPWLSDADVNAVTGHPRAGWTDVDLPVLDAARLRVGDPQDELHRRRERVSAAAEREVFSDVVTQLIAGDDSDLRIMSMLRGQDLRGALQTIPRTRTDPFAGPFAHIIVDEAQELTDAQWRMLLRRCPSHSFTIVGDRAQARHGFAPSWDERLRQVGFTRITTRTLQINYRTPEEVMAVAGPVILAALPDANVPTSIRHTGVPVRKGHRSELAAILDTWLVEHDTGTAVVVGDPAFAPRDRVSVLSPQLVKGLEFDLVILIDAERFGDGMTGAVDRYVAMTRATAELVLLRS